MIFEMIIKKSLVKSIPTIPSIIILTLLFSFACVDSKQQTTEPLSPTTIITPTQTPYTASSLEIIIAQEQLLTSIYRNTIPSIVQVKVESKISQRSFFGGLQHYNVPSEGTGFIWDNNGYVVTNHHVIQNADSVRVIFYDGTESVATVHGSDPNSDLAILKIEMNNYSLKAVPLGDSDTLSIGQIAIAIGSPFGQEFSMTQGIISALGRTLPNQTTNFSTSQIIQTDAAINPGNSGGPLLDRTGSVIGITSQIISSSGSNAGVGFAIPINTAKRIIPSLIKKGIFEYAYLGISGTSLTSNLAKANNLDETTKGALIVKIINNGPAFKSKLLGSEQTITINEIEYPTGGDIITHIDLTPVKSINDISSYINNKEPNEIVSLSIIRSSKKNLTIDVRLGIRP